MNALRTMGQGWHSGFRDLVKSVNTSVVLCSPFVGEQGTEFICTNLPPGFSERGRIDVITNLSIDNICRGATDPQSLLKLSDRLPNTTIHHVPGLHAKVYIFDDTDAIITSGNLTAGGLYRNLEYGAVISDRRLVQKVRSDLDDFASLGVAVPKQTLKSYCGALEAVRSSIRQERRISEQAFRTRFQLLLQPLEDELIRLRLAGGAMHTVFSRTIAYLLNSHGAMTTVDMHPMIAAIHPDLCDDSVDRIIDGKRFGKKWKHAVRTAQQQLKKQGIVNFDGTRWSLNG